jgi:hypothetical protein
MQITTPTLTTDEDKVAHADRVTAAMATQAPLWAVSVGHTLQVARGTLVAGDEVLLTDLSDHAGTLSLRDRMAALVAQGVVLRSPERHHRRADVAAADTARARFHVAAQAITTIAHMDGRTPCSAQGIATKGMRVLPSDVTDGLSGLLEIEQRGLVVRSEV